MTTVLGAGMSGLSAAYYLLQRFGYPATIYESSNRVGGWIRTERHRDKGFLFEVGPRTIRPKGIPGANTLKLIEELQLPVDPVLAWQPAAKNRMIYAKGQLCMLPNSLSGVFKTLPPFSKPLISQITQDLRAGRKKLKFADESIYDFVERRFGAELANYAISPLICGICAGDAKEISVRFLMNDLFEKEQKWGGIIKGMLFEKLFGKKQNTAIEGIFAEAMPRLYEKAREEKWSMYRVPDGLETLPRTLSNHLRGKNVNIQLSAECREITFSRNGVKMNVKGRDIDLKHVISSLPSYKLASCVKNQHPSLAALLMSIPYVDVAVVNLQYNTEELFKMKAFGFLVPPIERLPILGVIFDSCCFDMEGNTVLTVMMGGRWFEENFGKEPTPKKLLDTALQHLELVMGIKDEPRLSRVHVLKKCIPQYTVGHKQRVADIRRYINQYKLPLTLCGAAYDGVGINDVILSARTQVQTLNALDD
ncbi:PREDICTED: protoporphyrinogen oxidase [Rhagoletis zephyria]|uniref:protoporphyrinogen oxidase n=1 Tax=Rhagoletis zephyria TaxID=28612 RepID=UPI0008114BD7|nr:PREDICTED: protoporphyrinogen oxidase [Rhagoletis zephyria]